MFANLKSLPPGPNADKLAPLVVVYAVRFPRQGLYKLEPFVAKYGEAALHGKRMKSAKDPIMGAPLMGPRLTRAPGPLGPHGLLKRVL